MDCNFSGNIQRAETTVGIEDPKIDEDVKHRIKTGWLK